MSEPADTTSRMSSNGGNTGLSTGYIHILTAFGIWSIFPIYFKLVTHLPAFEVLCHRIFWGFVFCLILLARSNKLNLLIQAISKPKVLATCFASGALISLNWFTFIVAVGQGKILECSLGYFISPLLIVLLGRFFFREALRGLQLVSVIVAAIGVVYLIVAYGEIPIYGLSLAITFALYSMLRKKVPLESLIGLSLETLLMLPIVLGYFIYLFSSHQLTFGNTGKLDVILLIGIGALTALPLLFFASGARKIPMKTVGILQYLTPSVHFLLGIFLYKESFSVDKAISFGFIWAAVGIYIISILRPAKNSRQATSPQLRQTTNADPLLLSMQKSKDGQTITMELGSAELAKPDSSQK